MTLTLVEPHSHFELLLRWIPLCVRTEWTVNVICSRSNKEDLYNCIPEDCKACQFYDIANLPSFPSSDLVIFLSMQKGWNSWLTIARKHASALMIHNANTYLRPGSSFAPYKETGFSRIKYFAKWIYEKTIGIPKRREFLQSLNYAISYSTTQLNFLKEHCNKPICTMSGSFSRVPMFNKMPNVLIPIYSRNQKLDIPFFKKCLSRYQSSKIQQIDIICSRQELQELQVFFRQIEKVRFHEYPLSSAAYYKLVARSKYMCLPFRQQSVFNIYTELIGITKYSGRIRDALEYGCELHMPDYIPREDPNAIPGLEEAARQMEKKLEEMHKLASL